MHRAETARRGLHTIARIRQNMAIMLSMATVPPTPNLAPSRYVRRLSEHFSASEAQCRCGDCVPEMGTADVELVRALERIRSSFGDRPVRIHSWYRCRVHNNRPTYQTSAAGVPGAGSTDTSWHLGGGAADFSIDGVEPEAIAERIRSLWPRSFGVGIYSWGVHLDIDPRRARNWRG